jgi:Protein of unknown function (DUF3102)
VKLSEYSNEINEVRGFIDVSEAGAWVSRITAVWQQSVQAIIEVGRLLIAAKAALPHGEFGKMIASDLPFSDSTARKLMAIAADKKLSNREHVNVLPPSWGTLYELTKLEPEQFEARIASGAIRADMERKEVHVAMASRVQPGGDLDYAPTGPWITRALIEKALPQIRDVDFALREQKAWEPACGEGHIAEVLGEYFAAVHASDIHDYGYGQIADFLTPPVIDEFGFPVASVIDWIITNPPFEEKALAFALRALEFANVGVALFLQTRYVEGVGRYEQLFRDRPPTLLAFFVERAPCHMGRWEPDGDTRTSYMWAIWVKDRTPQAPFWIPPGCREALTRPDDEKRFTAHPVIRRKRERRS